MDTMGIEFAHVNIPYDIYSKWDDVKHHRNANYVVSQYGFTKYLSNTASIRYTYFPYIKGGLLKIEFSLPHIIYGNNIQMIYDIEKAIDIANSKMPKIPGVPQLNFWAGILYRLDVCFNFQVNDLVPWYIKALLALKFSYRRTRPYVGQGVQYENKKVILRIYDKARERKDMKDDKGALAAYGILRVEIELKRDYIKKLTRCRKPTLQFITRSWVFDVIENELRQLNLLDQPIGTVDSTLKVLREKYGCWEALALIGLLQTKITYPSTELLAQDAKLHKNSIGRHLYKKFAENGIPPTLTDYVKPLPPLVINRKIDFDKVICKEKRGDTHRRPKSRV